MNAVTPFAHAAPLPKIAGVRTAVAGVEIRYKDRNDVLLVSLDEGTNAAGVYTRSLMAAAPVEWCRTCDYQARALVVNSGNANAFTGKAGAEAVKATVEETATLLGCRPEQVYVASTGVIGEKLPHAKITQALPALTEGLTENGWDNAAAAIMTTDTFAKTALRTTEIGGVEVTLVGIAKGSGMIAPDMATMLGFVFTDAKIEADVLAPLLSRATHKSFNCITVDGETSTNDCVLLFATGKAGNESPSNAGAPELDGFKTALAELCEDLAKQIVVDGEGATKFVTLHVTGAEDDESARRIGLAIGNSPLVKTAIAGSDPNWGRIVAAIGKSGQWADRDRLKITIGDVLVTEEGAVSPYYVEAKAAEHMKGKEIVIGIDVGVGVGKATVWTCDYTEGYIRINTSYRS